MICLESLFLLIVFLFTIVLVVLRDKLMLFNPLIFLYLDLTIIYLVLILYLKMRGVFPKEIRDYISGYVLLWTLVYVLLLMWKLSKYDYMISVSQLELNSLIWNSTSYALFLRLLSSPLFPMLMFYFLWNRNELVYSSDVVFGSVIFSATIGLTILEKTITHIDNYPRLLMEKTMSSLTSRLLHISGHIIIGGYGNIGQTLSQRILQVMRYYPGSASMNHLKTCFLWIVKGGKFKLKRLFLNLIILDKNTDRWDYVFPHAIFKQAGIESVSPAMGSEVYVPIISSDLKSDHTWNALNFNESRAIVQTFENRETESYLLQKNTPASVVVRSTSSTLYSEITFRDKVGQIFRFYPAFELGTLLMRRIYAAVVETLDKGQGKPLLVFIGRGPELYYALKSWQKVANNIANGEYGNKKVLNIIITDDQIFKEMSEMSSNWIDSVHVGNLFNDHLFEYKLPLRHGEEENFVRFPMIMYPLSLVYAVLRDLINKNKSLVPIFIIVGKEGTSESISKEVFRVTRDMGGRKYYIIVPYFYRDEFRHILESAKGFGVNLNRLHLFQPYKEIQEGVSNYIMW